MKPPSFDLSQAHKYFAPTLNVECWNLIEAESRTEQDNHKLLFAAFASAYHWLHAGDEVNQQRAEWLIAKAYATLGDGANCLKHAERCMEWTDAIAEGLTEFDYAYAHEMLARGHAMTGNTEQAAKLKAKARELAAKIAGEKDREIFLSDLDWGEWNGVE